MCMLIKTMSFTGLRNSEICRLKTENFRQNYEFIEYYPLKKKRKTLKRRYLPSKLKTDWALYYAENHQRFRQGFVFPPSRASKNPHIQPSTVRHVFVRMRRKLGLDDSYFTLGDGRKLYRISPHTLRHQYTYKVYVATGKDIIATKNIVGHEDVKDTVHYASGFETVLNEKLIANTMWK